MSVAWCTCDDGEMSALNIRHTVVAFVHGKSFAVLWHCFATTVYVVWFGCKTIRTLKCCPAGGALAADWYENPPRQFCKRRRGFYVAKVNMFCTRCTKNFWFYRRCDSMTLLMKLTMAIAGCSGSSSAKRWQTFSATLPGFLATNPKILRGETPDKEGNKLQGKSMDK